MIVDDDPDASPAAASKFLVFALAFAVLTVLLYRPLSANPAPAPAASPEDGSEK
jgi:hypothetical protein